MKWEEIQPGMIVKTSDDRNYIWSLVIEKTPSSVFLVTYYQMMPMMKGKGYQGKSNTGVDFETLRKKDWSGYEEQVDAFPNAIKRPFIKKMFVPQEDW